MTQAIREVLASSAELGVREIHAFVEALLNEPVSQSSVKNCLATYSRRPNSAFERVGYGRYRLATESVVRKIGEQRALKRGLSDPGVGASPA